MTVQSLSPAAFRQTQRAPGIVASPASYRHRLVDPDLPPPSEYFTLLERIFEERRYSNFGPLVRQLESQLLEFLGRPEETCVTSCNATAGLVAALLASGRKGLVLVPAFTFPASLGAVRSAGMEAVVADVNRQSWTLDSERLDALLAITGAKAVMLVAPFGIARNWDREIEICRAHGASVVIDNASGLGGPRLTTDRGPGVFEVFSMHATKPFAVGEGGLIVAHRDHDAALRSALNFALERPSDPSLPSWGVNGKMSEFHAAIGIAQLRRFPSRVARRRAFADAYRARLTGDAKIACPQDISLAPWQFYPVLLPDARTTERFVERAGQRGVEIRRYYRPSLSQWPDVQCTEHCPIAESLAERMCVLPIRALDSSPDKSELFDAVFGALDDALMGA